MKDNLKTLIYFFFTAGEILSDVEAAIRQCWEPIIGDDFKVVVSIYIVNVKKLPSGIFHWRLF